MNRLQVTLLLAGWEFRRFFKWKSQLIGWGIGAGLMAAFALIGPKIFAETLAETTTVGVVQPAPFALAPTLGIDWRPGEEAELAAAFEAEELDALLRFDSEGAGELTCRDEGGWTMTLSSALDDGRRRARLEARGLSQEVLDDVNAPFALTTRVAGEEPEADDADGPDRWERMLALGILGFMFLGVFTGTALLFTGITTEKQSLVTEQIVAAVPPQTWIDGKILGTGLRSLAGTVEMLLWSLLGLWIWGDVVRPGAVDLGRLDVGLLVQAALLAAAGFALWFCFFAAVAATIDDPNTSARGALMLLPMVAPALAIPVWLHPDSGLALALSLAPPTATIAMTVRLILSEVPAWQVAATMTGMVGGVLLLRGAAGKVFAMAILMRGKEPGWREIWRAARGG